MSKILIKNGHVVDPLQGLDDIYDILIAESLVEDISEKISADDAEIIDAAGKFVFPGLVDIHVHAREPGEEYKEDIESASQAACVGGFTSIVLMPNTKPPIDSADKISFIYGRGVAAASWIYPVGTVSKRLEGKELSEMADMAQSGAVAFSDDGQPIADSELMRNALTYSQQLDLPILVHEMEPTLSANGQIHDGEVASLTGMKGIPSQAETSMISRDLDLLRLCGGRIHIQHISTKGAVELIRAAKKENLPVTCEVTPHHLLLDESAVLDSGFHTNFKMMPPLRSKEDIAALCKALIDGTIDAIATDHAPHAIHEKDCPFDAAPFGIIGLETAFSLMWTKFVNMGIISHTTLIELMSAKPAKILNLPAGTLGIGSFADIVIMDPEAKWSVDETKFFSKSRNSPFIGWELIGKIILTMVAGEIVFKL